MEQNMLESFIDKFTDDVIMGENLPNSVANNYFKKITRDPEYQWIYDIYVQKKTALSQIDESDPDFEKGKKEIFERVGFDTPVYLYALKEYKLQYMKKQMLKSVQSTDIKK